MARPKLYLARDFFLVSICPFTAGTALPYNFLLRVPPHADGAIKQAQKYFREGFVNTRILHGGVNAWKEAGYALVGSHA